MSNYSRSYSAHSSQTAPLGIKVICVLGVIGALGLLRGGLAIFSHGGAFAELGLLVAAIGVGQLIVLAGLWTLESWAWTAAIFLYALAALVSAAQIDFLGMVVSLLVAAYVASKADYYR